ncbi:MAG: tryptophan--tRNA ligase, partial [Eubacteriales bacterium]|nr:tryptophan--tRNA ligase [Eubacteriales bacterium]
PIAKLEEQYQGKGYGDLKKDLVEVVWNNLEPIQKRYHEIRDSGELSSILKDGAERAEAVAEKTMKRVKERFGLGR